MPLASDAASASKDTICSGVSWGGWRPSNMAQAAAQSRLCGLVLILLSHVGVLGLHFK